MVEDVWDPTHRLILATYADATEPYVAALADDPDDVAALVDLAAATNERLRAQRDIGTVAIGADELVFGVDDAKIVNASFTYPGQGARFSDRTRGAWYCSTEVETSLAEVVHHRTVHLAETDWWEDVVDYQDVVCSIGGRGFADLRRRGPRERACLDPDSYVASQTLAARLLAGGAAGVVYPAVRRAGGTNIACFRPVLVPPVWRGARYRVEFAGSPTPRIRSAH
jgi:hypothetical protein